MLETPVLQQSIHRSALHWKASVNYRVLKFQNVVVSNVAVIVSCCMAEILKNLISGIFLTTMGIFPEKETVAMDHHSLYVIVLFHLQMWLASYLQNTLKNAMP